MNKYKSEADIKNKIFQITTKLSQVEVKGDSVELIFASRLMLKELFESINEVEEEEENAI